MKWLCILATVFTTSIANACLENEACTSDREINPQKSAQIALAVELALRNSGPYSCVIGGTGPVVTNGTQFFPNLTSRTVSIDTSSGSTIVWLRLSPPEWTFGHEVGVLFDKEQKGVLEFVSSPTKKTLVNKGTVTAPILVEEFVPIISTLCKKL